MKQAQVLNEREVKRVLTSIKRRSYSTRDRAMFMLSYLAGLRARNADPSGARPRCRSSLRFASGHCGLPFHRDRCRQADQGGQPRLRARLPLVATRVIDFVPAGGVLAHPTGFEPVTSAFGALRIRKKRNDNNNNLRNRRMWSI